MESLIRQAVNLRLKGNGKFWRQHNAESLLHCRCQWLSGGWNAFALGDFNSSHISQLCLIFLSASLGLYFPIKNLNPCR